MDRQRSNRLLVSILMLTLFNVMDVYDLYLFMERLRRNTNVSEIIFTSNQLNDGAPINLTIDGSYSFTDFSTKVMKLDTLFKEIHFKSNNLFEGVKSVKIVPYCIPAEAFKNNEICFKNTEIHNLENLKLESIELGRSTIHNKKENRFLYVSHKFDELVINGTIDFMDIGNLDKYNTSIFNNNLIVYRDYNNQGIFSLEIPFPVGYSESNPDKYVKHAVDMQLMHAHDMIFHLPVRGFNGLLDLIENEISTPFNFFPENIIFSCGFSETFGTKNHHTISINTKDMRLNKQLNNDVFNNVKFVEKGNSYQIQLAITFNKLAFTTKMSVKINQNLELDGEVTVEMKKLHVDVDYLSNGLPVYKVKMFILNGLSISAEQKLDSYFYSPHFKGKLSSCIRATTIYQADMAFLTLKFPNLQATMDANTYTSLV